jgi:hypothetical protein
VTVIMSAISPEDYDEAVRRSPSNCPLYLAGDRRPGHLLLLPPPPAPPHPAAAPEDCSVAVAARAPPASPAAAAIRRLALAAEEVAAQAQAAYERRAGDPVACSDRAMPGLPVPCRAGPGRAMQGPGL